MFDWLRYLAVAIPLLIASMFIIPAVTARLNFAGILAFLVVYPFAIGFISFSIAFYSGQMIRFLWKLVLLPFRILFAPLGLFLRARTRTKRARHAWDWIVLPEGTKEELMTLQEILKRPKTYKKRWGQNPPLGMVLHGPPGTGKTMIARTLAHSTGYYFLTPSPADVQSMWIGESEKRIHELYRQARANAPCIVFIDELDAIAAQRSGGPDPTGSGRHYNNALNQLLQEIDGFRRTHNVFTVGATNRIDLLDKAILSRLSLQVYVGLPDEDAREHLFYLYTYPYRKRLTISLGELAYASEDLSGRDIKEICSVAAMRAHGRRKDTVGYEEFAEAFTCCGRVLLAQASVKDAATAMHLN